MLGDIAQSLLDLLFPPRCVACGTAGAMLCASCLARTRTPEPPLCARCGQVLLVGERGLCLACGAGRGPVALEIIRAAAMHEGPVREAVLALKYRGQRRLAQPLGDVLAGAVTRLDMRPDVIVPVPLHATRKRQRGYNQAELLARRCARRLRLPFEPALLVRTRATPPQVGLSGAERHANVAGAFAVTSPARVAALLTGKRVLLLDDVTTTGSTLDAAAAALAPFAPAALLGLAVTRPDLSDDARDAMFGAQSARARRGSRT
ncbi:MAG TPA: ComF family protein [Ktedonobacterales bacterium]|nr:ComF family protein [Ktedonobacterales bacterium]